VPVPVGYHGDQQEWQAQQQHRAGHRGTGSKQVSHPYRAQPAEHPAQGVCGEQQAVLRRPEVQHVQGEQHEDPEYGLHQQVVEGQRADQGTQQRAPKQEAQPVSDFRAQ
jgi:hypothetical protein